MPAKKITSTLNTSSPIRNSRVSELRAEGFNVKAPIPDKSLEQLRHEHVQIIAPINPRVGACAFLKHWTEAVFPE